MKKKIVAIMTGASMIGMALMPVAGLAQTTCTQSPGIIANSGLVVDINPNNQSAPLFYNDFLSGPITTAAGCSLLWYGFADNAGKVAQGPTANLSLNMTCADANQARLIEVAACSEAGCDFAITTVQVNDPYQVCDGVTPDPTVPPFPVMFTVPAPPACGDFVTKWGSLGTGDLQFNGPVGNAVDASGNVYVVDSNNDRVQKFSSNGTYLSTIGGPGTGNGQFSNPKGVAVDSSGNVYVTDYTQNRVQKFDSSGVYLSQWGSNGTAPGQFKNPWGIAVDSSDNVYVTEYSGYRVQKFNSTGGYLLTIGTGITGTGNGEFQSEINGVATDASGNVYVLDTNNQRVQKFNSSGVYLSQWGSQGFGDGQFSQPRDITIDATGKVFVVDGGASPDSWRVQVFTDSGTFVTKWGTAGTGDGQFTQPRGIAADASGNVYVVDGGNRRVQKFIDGEYCVYTPPAIQTCALDALAVMGITPGTYPEMDEALDAACEDGNEDDDGLTIIEPGDVPNNYKLTCPESLVIAEGAEIGQNSIGSNDCDNELFLGNGAIVNGNVLKTEDVWVAGTGNSITGNINHEVSIHVGPGADLYVGKSINDLQTLEVGLAGLLRVSDNMDVWVDIINAGTVEVGNNFDCNGLSGVPTMSGDIFADNDNCPYVSAGPLAGGFTTWIYAAIVAILGFGAALIIQERKKKA